MSAKPNIEAITGILQRIKKVMANRRENHGTDANPVDPALEQTHAAQLAGLKTRLAQSEARAASYFPTDETIHPAPSK